MHDRILCLNKYPFRASNSAPKRAGLPQGSHSSGIQMRARRDAPAAGRRVVRGSRNAACPPQSSFRPRRSFANCGRQAIVRDTRGILRSRGMPNQIPRWGRRMGRFKTNCCDSVGAGRKGCRRSGSGARDPFASTDYGIPNEQQTLALVLRIDPRRDRCRSPSFRRCAAG
ncbi:protein of unknown function [Burkholderia multivorans]